MDKLLQLLESDALLTPDKLASMLQLKTDEVKKRIQKYQKDGVILGSRTIINHDKLGENRVQAVIEVRITPEREGGFDRTAERIAKFNEVTNCFLTSGAYDLLIFVEGRTLQEVASFVSSKLSTLDRVQSTATHFMLKTYKAHGVMMSETASEERMTVTP